MKTIKVSDATYRAIADAAILPFRSTATREPDGGWMVPVEEETWGRIKRVQIRGETDDYTIMRCIRICNGSKPS